MPPPSVWAIEHRIGYKTNGGLFSENVLVYAMSGTPIVTDPEHIALKFSDAWDTACRTELLACLAQDVAVTAYQTRVISTTSGPTISTVVDLLGTVTHDVLSNSVAICLRFFTAVAKSQGRMFLPGVPETWVDGDVILSAADMPINNYMTALLGPIVDADANSWYPVLWSKKTGLTHSILAWAVRTIITAMRRRLYPNPYVF